LIFCFWKMKSKINKRDHQNWQTFRFKMLLAKILDNCC
jgi:hypothetical protein